MTSVDEENQTVTCPNGKSRPISATRIATFGALCRDCPLRERCTTSKTGRRIVLHGRDDLLRKARRDWKNDPDLPERYRHRPNVERVVSQAAGRGGRRWIDNTYELASLMLRSGNAGSNTAADLIAVLAGRRDQSGTQGAPGQAARHLGCRRCLPRSHRLAEQPESRR